MARSFMLEVDGKRLPASLEQAENDISIALGGRTYSVTLRRNGDLITVQKDGKLYQVTVRKVSSRMFETEMFGEIHRVAIRETDSAPPPRKETTKPAAKQELSKEEFTVRTPIPGTLVSIEVELGEEVTKGECVCVVEAMKLYNEIEAPHEGIVKEIKASPETAVMAGDAIIVLSVKTA
jgi:biotin carboxyl carrier protein